MHLQSTPIHKTSPSIASPLSGPVNTSGGIRRGKLEISNPIPIFSPEGWHEPGSRIDGSHQQYQLFAPSVDCSKPDTWPRRSTATGSKDFQSRHGYSDSDAVLPASTSCNANRASAAFTSTHHSMSSVHSSGSVRRSGGIRATFRKMFGSKRWRDTALTGGTDQLSVSSSLRNHPHRKPSGRLDEFIRGRALNSHAPSMTTPEPTQAHNNGAETIRCFVDGFSRRNSLPSVVLSSQEAQKLDLTLNQLGNQPENFPRPLRRMPHRSLIDSVRRKSRSADALREMAHPQNTVQAQERRLSDEIKYWRTSIIEDPIPSFASARQEMEEQVEAAPATSSPASTSSARHPSKDVAARPQGFGFSGLILGNGDASVEQRITTVEVKLVDLECAVANLQRCETTPTVVLGNPRSRSKATQDLSAQASARSFRTPTIFPKSSFDSFSTASTTSKSKREATYDHRNSAANTGRPQTAVPFDASTPVAAHPPLLLARNHAESEFARLLSMLSQEQEARRGLESQLKDLQRQIHELRFMPAALPRGAPPPNHFSTPTSQVLDLTSLPTHRRSLLPFRNATSRSNLNKSTSIGETEGEETDDTDDGFLDVFETPTEAARDRGFGMDGHGTALLVGVM